MSTEIYRVKSGESLSIISRNLLGNIDRWPEIAFLNGIRHPYFIYPGQILELPQEKDSDIIEVEHVQEPTLNAPTISTAGSSNRSATVLTLLAVGAFILFNK